MIEQLAEFLRIRGADFATFGVVFDIGSRDGLQALEFSRLFPDARIVAVECNPATLDKCRRNLAPEPRITLVDKAINAHTGRCAFHSIDQARTITTWKDGNPGASSLFVATGDYPVETYFQNQVEVDCTRLDDLCEKLQIEAIDLIWMDLQGAELIALQSAGALLEKVRYIYTEVSHRPIYKGQCLFEDVDAFLKARGFRLCTKIDRTRWQQDAIYENTRKLMDVVIPLAGGEREIAELSVRSVRSFVTDVRNIYLVGPENPGIARAHFVDERSFPFDIDTVRQTLGPQMRAEPYAQQLMKLYFPLVHRASLKRVLTVNPGTVFLRTCRFIEDGRPVFNFSDDHHPSYFAHMTRLHPSLHRMFAYSGVTPCMLFTRAWLEQMHKEVEAQNEGLPFWKAYLQAIDPCEHAQGASEQELYFHFSLMFHATGMTIRHRPWSNIASWEGFGRDRLDFVSLSCEMRKEPLARIEQFLFPTSAGSGPGA